MQIERCKWYNNARSPVLFMIDDLANAWVDTSGNGIVDEGEDWGFFRDEERSSFRFLQERVLADHPEVKVTFFVPVGERVGMIRNPVCSMYSKPINADEASRDFFRQVHQHPSFELAYHGTTHGVVGEEAKDFVQEWASFSSLNEALVRIGEGLDIFMDAVGTRPMGGKYCGYTSNTFSDESIDESGFEWWCRYWNRGKTESSNDPSCGTDSDPVTNYDVKRFGKSGVLDIPSTVNGALLNSVYHGRNTIKDIVKQTFKKSFIRWKLREIDGLLKRRLVISVQEHIAPSRDDGKRQSPNIFDDRESLLQIFRHIRGKKVWYCTCSELADYVNLRDHVQIEHRDQHHFELRHEAQYRKKLLSLWFGEKRPFRIMLPDRSALNVVDGVANLPVLEGIYSIVD
ncbi:hypothetical protein J23TS9_26600 [Paenibacillus sp. J23TS9]|uniref:hypothetical protein n=1 Tax=Paenibacillus sp. J23TS9 TaxID=2807193 RepID=UPI001B2C42E5|nr:hypothetical protein [Paenibacillus sp. J23TS9]GIP27530.1 hypothetical protein J23TS9_26600 [Paenibacillus sp. J23TS9]